MGVTHRALPDACSWLARAGAAFIKWGQWAATRPDLFPKDMCEQLTQLHSNAPAHSFKTTRKIVEAAFGRRLSELFDDFEEVPVASGSIAQVSTHGEPPRKLLSRGRTVSALSHPVNDMKRRYLESCAQQSVSNMSWDSR